MNLTEAIEGLEAEEVRASLARILTAFVTPAFGALPKRETEILIFDEMRRLGLLPETASVYDLMTDLRITRAKANGLLFDVSVRRIDANPAILEHRVKEALSAAKFHKDRDDYFILEVEDPMVNAHLKEVVRRAGHISDSSFNPSLVRLPLAAVADVTASLLDEARQEEVRVALVAAGAPEEPSFRGVLIGALSRLGERVIGKGADRLAVAAVDEAGAYLRPLLRDLGGIPRRWGWVFRPAAETAAEA